MNIHTKVYTTPLVITREMGVFRLAFKAIGGSISFSGTFPFEGSASEAIPIAENEGEVITANPNSPIECTIDPNGNSVAVRIYFN